uniref:Uncharacterized protein n=1 Tax=Cacopsylla melanoneura TaxID=428564 RepID=A0A8D8VXR4_9HEMI
MAPNNNTKVFREINLIYYIAKILGMIPLYGRETNSIPLKLLSWIYSKLCVVGFVYIFYLVYLDMSERLANADEEMKFIYIASFIIDQFFLGSCFFIVYFTYFQFDYFEVLDQLSCVADCADRLNSFKEDYKKNMV